MARDYLKDIEFLQTIDEMRIKEHFINLQIMNFQEEPLRQIQGIATQGNITINGAASVRRTINLTMVAPENENDLSNIDNVISANKKVKVEVGIRNPLSTYAYYGDILWFPMGVYLITEATSSTTASSATINIKGKDKMCQLDGSCGGVLPATVVFHEAQIQGEDEEYSIEQIPIYTIIKECVTHYGDEKESNIIINDIDLVARQSVKYIGSTPIWFTDNYESFVFSETTPTDYTEHKNKFVYGQDIGYMETDFIYPGELVFEAGQTVTEVLDKIISAIGNYEYFYDLEGRFVFQEKKNYLNNYYTPITELNDYYYIKAFSDSKYYTTFENAKDSISYYNSPKYENIKNDFVVWGVNTTSTGITKNIKYHVAIDEKPNINLAEQFMYEVTNGNGEHLYYLFDYEEQDYKNDPEPKPIEIEYNKNTVINDEELLEALTTYIETNYVSQASSEDSFVLYFKIIWDQQVRYYYAKIQEHTLLELIYLEDYTIDLSKESIVLGIYVPEEEIKKESDDNYNQLIPVPDSDIEGNGNKYNPDVAEKDDNKDNYDNSIDVSGAVDDETVKNFNKIIEKIVENEEKYINEYNGLNKNHNDYQKQLLELQTKYAKIHKELLKELEKALKKAGISFINTTYGKEKGYNSAEEAYDTFVKDFIIEDKAYTIKYFLALKIKSIPLEDTTYYYSLGYNDKNGVWKELYKLEDKKDISIAQYNNIINNISKQFTIRIFIFPDFDEENKDRLSNLETINNSSLYYANPQILKFEDGSLGEFYYVFNNIIINDNSVFTADQRKILIEGLAPLYLKNSTKLIADINMVYSIKEEDDENYIFPWLEENPTMEFYIIPKSETTKYADLIYKYKQAFYSQDDLVKEILEYCKNYVLKTGSVKEEYILRVITKEIEEEPEFDYSQNFFYELIGRPCGEWREELYRQALLNQESAGSAGYYDEELLAFWRENFDTMNNQWYIDWEKKIKKLENEIIDISKAYEEENSKEKPDENLLNLYLINIENFQNQYNSIQFRTESEYKGWNPAIYEDPGLLNFWLDFIDSEQLITKYSVNQIGRRSKAISKEGIKMLYKLEVPDVIFFENKGDFETDLKIEEYQTYGQKYCALKRNQMNYFSSSGTSNTAFDLIREMIYTHLYYNTSVTINCVPKYYLEPNNLIYINDRKSNIQGDFVINQLTIPLTYNGTMTINANQALVRV